MNKDKPPSAWKDEPISADIARRDSRGSGGWSTSETNPTSPGGWGQQNSHPGSESRRGTPYRGRGYGFAPRGGGRPRYGGPEKSQQQLDEDKAQKELLEREPWRGPLAEVSSSSSLSKLELLIDHHLSVSISRRKHFVRNETKNLIRPFSSSQRQLGRR